MTEQLESALREALAEHVAELPSHAGARVRGVDYYSRTQHRRAVLAAGGLAASVGAVAATVSIVGLGTGTQPALAGWSASPTKAASGETASAEATCIGQISAPAAKSPAGPWSTVLTDTRGAYTVMIFQNERDWASCFAGYPDGATGGATGGIPPLPPAGQIKLIGLANGPAQPYTLIYGRVGAGVSGVTLPLGDGTRVTATVEHGCFAAWWPGDELARTAELSTENGTVAQPLPATP